jgi:hypothetical protein
MAMRAETRITEHEGECSRRYADTVRVLEAINMSINDGAVKRESQIGKLYDQIASVRNLVIWVVFVVGGTTISALVIAVWELLTKPKL